MKLYYNDYNIESPGAKSTAAQKLVKQLQKRNIQIDGVGLESHFIAGMLGGITIVVPSQLTWIHRIYTLAS